MTVRLAVKIYKEQLVLNRLTNSSFADSIVPNFVGGGGFVLTVLVVTIVQSYDSHPPTVLFNYMFSSLLLLILAEYVFQVGGNIRTISNEALHHLSRPLLRGQKSLGWRSIRSCRELRIYVGHSMYFIPLSFMLFVKHILEMSINILLTLPR